MSYSFLMEVITSRFTYFFLMGVGALFGAGFVYQDHSDRTVRATYKPAACQITESVVTVEEHVHHGGGRFGRFRRYSTYTFYPEITYTYTVNGQDHENDVYRYSEQGMTEEEANRVVNQYPEGRSATCYYSPDDPEEAVLCLQSDTRGMYVMGALGLFFLLLGLGGWVMIDFVLPASESKPRRRRQPAPESEVPGLKWLSETEAKEPQPR
jgi:hypothetical protein